jgi:glucose-6-phosphate isomerase
MDQHFLNADIKDNLPLTLALAGIWYNNFHGTESITILPYDQYMHRFAVYFQQGDMESNGKSVRALDGRRVGVQTDPIIWGEPGTNNHHAFYQLIHQGTKVVPCNFLAPIKTHNDVVMDLSRPTDHHPTLLSNYFTQTEAMALGKGADTVRAELRAENIMDEDAIDKLAPHKVFNRNRLL